MALLVPLMVLSLARSAGAFGSVTNFYPAAIHPNGSVEVVVRLKWNSADCVPGRWECHLGDCGTEVSTVTGSVYQDAHGFCQVEQVLRRRTVTNAPFQIRSNVVEGVEEDESRKNITVVDLRTRSDSGEPNSSPQASMLPAVRVPLNCPWKFPLMRFDSDGDDVRCVYVSISKCEDCVAAALLPSFFPSEPCTMVYTPGLGRVGDRSWVSQVLEDFPRTDLTLLHTNGSRESRSPDQSLSRVLVQYVFTVGPSVPSCEEGLYLPRLLPPTPDHGAQVFTAVHQQLTVYIRFAANYSTPSAQLFHNGPRNMVQAQLRQREHALLWTPSDGDQDQHFPVCFVLQVSTMFGRHESVPRCFVVTVVKVPKFLPPTPANATDLTVFVDQPVAIFIQVETVSESEELVFSGPDTMRSSALGRGSFLLFWVPSDADRGRRLDVSFYATFPSRTFGPIPLFNYYQSEFRIVSLIVSNKMSADPGSDTGVSTAFLRTKILSATPLGEAFLQKQVLQQLKQELVSRGLSPKVSLRLISRRKSPAPQEPPE